MNYLSHILLSGKDLSVAVGNFIGDGVKGRIREDYPREIRIGLFLHRFMDHLADTDPVNREGREKLFLEFGKYAGVVQDMYHDHFLSLHWNEFQEKEINQYLDEFYSVADEYIHLFPRHQLMFLNGVRRGNWLVNYSDLEGMQRAFFGLSKRIGRPSGVERAGDFLKNNHSALEKDFFNFFPIIEAKTAFELERLWTKL